MIRKFFPLFVISFFLFAACGNSKKKLVDSAPLISKTYKDSKGRTLKLPKEPARIISLAPNITESLFAIGGTEKLVGRSQACDYPEAAKQIPVVITYPSLDIEQLWSMVPELVLATDEIYGPDAIATLEQRGVPVFVQTYKTFEEIYKGIETLGMIVSKEERAKIVVDSLKLLAKNIQKASEPMPKYRTVIIVAEEPLKVIGGEGYMHEMIEKAGGSNIFADKKEAYPTISIEELLEKQPEYIILPTDDINAYPRLIAAYPYLQTVPADVNHQVFSVSPDEFYRPGPRTMEGLMHLTTILHTQLTRDSLLNVK